MAQQLATLEMSDSRRWRAWLSESHEASPGVWLVFHRRHAGVGGLEYEESVREALCFGWIDSIVKRLDDDRYARKFTPRRPRSVWSDLNRRRWAELKAEGRLAPAGLAAAPTTRNYKPLPPIPELPGYFERALRACPPAWAHFRTLSASQRRNFVTWIHLAKRKDTRERRIRESIKLLSAGRQLGLK